MDEIVCKNLVDRLLAAAGREIRLEYGEGDGNLSPAGSRIGGKPAVPHGFVWPYYTGTAFGEDESRSRPLSFLAQINLGDADGLDADGLLPKRGILSFFYELETMTWGFDPKDRGSARVFYFPEEDRLGLAEFPDDLSVEGRLPELAVTLKPHISIPDYSEFEDRELFDCDDYESCRTECGYEYDGWSAYTKLLGFPDVIQGPMQAECEAVSRGYYQGDPAGYKKIPDAEKADIKAKSRDWTLLFQMGTVTCGDFELMFGDCGHIYFWIRRSDLVNRDFDNVWLVLQCG